MHEINNDLRSSSAHRLGSPRLHWLNVVVPEGHLLFPVLCIGFLAMMIASLAFVAALGYNNGVSQRPALGWNTWCTMGMCGQGGVSPGKMSLHDVCNETEIKSIGAAMISSGLYDMGYDRVNLDDCWVGENRSADGTIAWDPLRFPNGMKPVIDWLHERGLRFGLYSSMGSTTCNNNGRTWPGSTCSH